MPQRRAVSHSTKTHRGNKSGNVIRSDLNEAPLSLRRPLRRRPTPSCGWWACRPVSAGRTLWLGQIGQAETDAEWLAPDVNGVKDAQVDVVGNDVVLASRGGLQVAKRDVLAVLGS